ncbi:hypothetical protein [Mucilaginibacter auburnensis]|uniref:LTXXQ motif family protein n=1 Tax=Mucilaginibacter auburnensis TaxID=1457233 RepID=A0A2H9VP09_9SPHI|nr:hypothetical protein [Mucilaginibacter auburnensis]PJJ80043.1 hypothetical protein CLV57_3187 [Mucilaginibacter auburnensis]
MKKTLLICLVTAFFGLSQAKAQSKLTAEQRTELLNRFKTYREKLNLSEQQAPQVRSIDSVYLTGLVALKQSSDRRLAKFQKMKQLTATRDTEMKKVLTADQFKTYATFKDEMRDELKELRQANKN